MATTAPLQATACASICIAVFVGRPASAGVLEDYVAAWNTHDINKAADFFTENAIRELIPLRATQHGRDEIRKAMELFFKTIPDAKCEIKESFVADGRGYYEWIVSGHCHVNFVWAAQSGGSPAAPIMLRVGCMSPGARF